MDPLKTAGAALGAGALLLLVLVQFLPWATAEGSESGFDYELEARTWEAEGSIRLAGLDESDSHGWYSDEADGTDGVGQIRVAIPFLLAGMLALLLGAVLGFARPGPAGPFVTLAAAVLLGLAAYLFIDGLNAVYAESGLDPEWGASFYLAIAACVLTLVGGTLGLVAGNRRASAA